MSIYEFKREDAEDFARFIGARVRVSGEEMVFTKCPFCGETSNDKFKFAINLKTGQYNCFRASCRAKGNMVTLSKAFNYELPGYSDEYYNARKRYLPMWKEKKRPTPTDPAIEYLKSRGISEAVCRKYEITTSSKSSDLLMLPFYDENNLLQLIKYRNMKATKENGLAKEYAHTDKKTGLGCKPILFGMNQCNREDKTLIMTEGQIDSLSVAEAGYTNAVSVPNGCNGFTWVPYCWDFLQSFDRLIVFGDYEHGKITLLEDMQKYFNGEVLHVQPEDYKDCKDANDILRKYGAEQVRACIENAVPVANKNFIRLADVRPRPISEMVPMETGIEKLDKILGGFYFGQLIVLTGERGEGKSTLSNQFALFAVNAGVKTFIYSGELPNGSLKDWIDHQAAGKRHMMERQDKWGETYCELDAETCQVITDWYADELWIYQNAFLEDPDAEDDNQQIIEVVTEAAKRGFRFVIIDNLMTALDDDARIDIYRAQTKFVKQLVRIAKARDIIIVLVAHQRKNQGTNRTADDVAGSANITNLADIVMTFGKPKDKETAESPREIRIQKNRLTGKLGGPIPIWFEQESRRVSDSQDGFGFALRWEAALKNDGFMETDGDVDIPFDM